jgi:hypothetical protein
LLPQTVATADTDHMFSLNKESPCSPTKNRPLVGAS